MKIGIKITLIAVVGFIATVICTVVGVMNIKEFSDSVTNFGNTTIVNQNAAANVLERLHTQYRLNSLIYIVDKAEVPTYVQRINKAAEELETSLNFLKDNIDAEDQALYEKLSKIVASAHKGREILNDFYLSNRWDEALAYRRIPYRDTLNAALAAAHEFGDLLVGHIEDYCHIESDKAYEESARVLFITLIVLSIVSVTLSFVIITGITRPLKKAVDAANCVAEGDLKVDLSTTAKDEIGTLMHSLDAMVKSINRLVTDTNTLSSAAIDGDFKHRADASKHQGDFRKIMEGTNALVEAFVEPLEATSNFLQGVSVGSENIQKITTEYKGEFNVIKDSVNKVHDILFAVLGGIISTAAEAEKGNLDAKVDTSIAQGAWIVIMGGLNKITEAANAIITDAGGVLSSMAMGDLTPRITKDYPGKFGEMKDNINNLGNSLTDLISRLAGAIHTTASASAEILATAETIATAIQEQSSQTAEVASAVEEMSKTVTDNAHNATKTADVAKKSGEVANHGGKVVQQTVDKIREISEVVKSSAENISKLGESSKKIGEIISVIDDIADQTNLLSLNAAIEAARAGEQGRGFAVVADSVGKLSINTTNATKQIENMIKGIQMETDAAVKAMENGTSKVQSGIELADSAGNSIQSILSSINELLDMINQIATASEKQSTTSEQISKNVSSISKVTAESARNVEDVAHTVNELAKMTETLTSLVSQFKIESTSSSTSSRYLE